MIINKLIVQNMGVFFGKQEFDLRPRKDKNIILIGGMNGAGKTTLFTTIRLCLYGILAFGRRKKAEYHDYLAKTISRKTTEGDTSYIELSFDYVQSSEKNIYTIRRTWTNKKDGIHELLEVCKDGQLIADLDPEQWEDFIQELIPVGISELFFFDGEKIQSLAEDNNQNLSSSIKSLLNLEIIERLNTDLSIYLRKQGKKNKETKEQTKIDEEIRKRCEEMDNIIIDVAELNAKFDLCVANIEKQELRISQEGGSFAKRREKLKTSQAKAETLIKERETKIKDLCAGLFPFSLAPNLCKSLKKQLEVEQKLQNWESNIQYFEEKKIEIEKELATHSFWNKTSIDTKEKELLVSKFITLLQNATSNDAFNETKIIHGLSAQEQQFILEKIKESSSEIPSKMKKLCSELDNQNKNNAAAERDLKRIPRDEALKPLVKELLNLTEERDDLRGKQKKLEENKNSIKFKIEELKRKQKKLEQQSEEAEKNHQASQTALKVQEVLKTYMEELTSTKVKDLANATTACFEELCRKKNWVHHTSINKDNYSVTLYDQNNNGIPKEKLSAGEKQIYAIALLWGLAKTSQRPLPIIIDTPLGRLDSKHRELLVNNYFPNVSHQTIILSTDTEIDEKFFEGLQPNISHVYHLQHDIDESATNVTEGYFWQ